MERIFIYDRDGTLINDPERTTDYASNLRYSSRTPKGFYTASFQVRRTIGQQWVVKEAHKIKVLDGLQIVWEGFIQAINLSSRGLMVRVDCVGPISILAQRVIRKTWIDNAPWPQLYAPDAVIDNQDQNTWNVKLLGAAATLKLPGQAYTAGTTEKFTLRYDTVEGENIFKVTYDYYIEAGASETVQIRIFNIDQLTAETPHAEATSSSTSSGTQTVTLSAGDTDTIDIYIGYLAATDGDADGIVRMSNLKIWMEYTYTTGIGSSYADEIIKDILYIVDNTEGDLSTDWSLIQSPAYALAAFATKGDTFESADTVIQRAVSYGDGSANTWEFSIWDSSNSSDGKPQAELRQRPATTDWEYEITLSELSLSSFSYEDSLDELYNWIAVEYIGPDGKNAFLWPDTQATLKDQTSIDTYGRRDKLINVGKSDSTTALENGERYLARHKDPLLKGQMTAIGQVRTKEGLPIPAGWVRAGERVKVLDFDGGTVFYLGEVEYNAETHEVRMSPDLPPDNLAVLQAQQSLEIERPVL